MPGIPYLCLQTKCTADSEKNVISSVLLRLGVCLYSLQKQFVNKDVEFLGQINSLVVELCISFI